MRIKNALETLGFQETHNLFLCAKPAVTPHLHVHGPTLLHDYSVLTVWTTTSLNLAFIFILTTHL